MDPSFLNCFKSQVPPIHLPSTNLLTAAPLELSSAAASGLDVDGSWTATAAAAGIPVPLSTEALGAERRRNVVALVGLRKRAGPVGECKRRRVVAAGDGERSVVEMDMLAVEVVVAQQLIVQQGSGLYPFLVESIWVIYQLFQFLYFVVG
ncbi:unnamed protein product [Linum trigynum]|uniref:Uncharacterized protein n=1 Tax=Linum trigynum TaxID=586398 RepID=A0AAV2FUN2_9ROSI